MKFLCVLLALLFVGCSSTTTISTDDKDVKIFVDGEYRGKGTAVHSDTKMMGSSTTVTLKKQNCEDQVHVFQRNEEFDAGACAGGCFVLVPWLWIQKYKPTHDYSFECTPKGN